jgi:hypothetical protein
LGYGTTESDRRWDRISQPLHIESAANLANMFTKPLPKGAISVVENYDWDGVVRGFFRQNAVMAMTVICRNNQGTLQLLHKMPTSRMAGKNHPTVKACMHDQGMRQIIEMCCN